MVTHAFNSSTINLKINRTVGHWWHTPLIPAVERQRLEDLCELKASLVYTERVLDRLQSYRKTLSLVVCFVFSVLALALVDQAGLVDSPASASQVLGLKACSTTAWQKLCLKQTN